MHVTITGKIMVDGGEVFIAVEDDEGQYEDRVANTYGRIKSKLWPVVEIKKEED